MLKEKLTVLIEELTSALRDADKFDGGNAAAGVRLRKQAQTATQVLREVRKEVSLVKSQRKAEKVSAPAVA